MTRTYRIEILDKAMVEVLRGKTVTERVAMVFEAERTLRQILDAHIRWQYPQWSDEQVMQEIARRFSRASD